MLIQEPQPSKQPRNQLIISLLLYILPLFIGLVYWLAFFPGVMSYDSVSQWDQFSRLSINNLHPATTTIVMWLLTRLWYSPAIVSLFQVVFASLVTGYGLSSIYNQAKLPAWLLVLLAVLVSANPLVGIINVTLWKDVIYGLLVLLLTIFMFNIVKSDGEWIARPFHFVILGVTLSFIYLYRFNGLPIVIVSLVGLLLIYRKYIKSLLYSSVISLAIILVIIGPLFTVFKVDRAVRFTYGIPFIHPVVAYVSANQGLDSLSPLEKQYLNLIYPLDKPWNYSCYDASVFFFQDTNLYPAIQLPMRMVKIFAKLAAQNPLTTIRHFVCLSSFVWQPNQPKGVYLETVLFESFNPDQTPGWSVYKNIIGQDPLLPQVHNFLRRLVNAEWHRDVSLLLWRPALYMYVFLIGVILVMARTRLTKWFLLAIPLLAQTLGIMFTAQTQAVRYQYPVYLISLVFTVPLFIMALKIPPQPDNPAQ